MITDDFYIKKIKFDISTIKLDDIILFAKAEVKNVYSGYLRATKDRVDYK